MNKFSLALLASAALLCASPALAGDCKGNCPSDNGGDTSSSAVAAALGVGVGIGTGGSAQAGATGGSVGDIDVRGGAGGAGGSVFGSGNATQGQDQGQGQQQANDQGQSQALTSTQANQQTATAAGGASTASSAGQTTSVTTNTNYKRAASSAAWAQGSTGSDKTCRFGPAASAQWLAGGGSAALTVFKDKDCQAYVAAETVRLQSAGLIDMARAVADLAGSAEAGIQYLASKDAAVNAAVTLARTSR